jgi:hypothetical protein
VGQHVSTRQKSAVVEPVATCQDSRKGWERKDLHPVSHKRYDLITHITLFLSSAPIFQWVILGPGAGGGTRLCCCSLLKACGWWSGEVLWEGRERERESVCVCVCAQRRSFGQWTRKRTVVSFSSIRRQIINVSHGPVGWEGNYTIQKHRMYACMHVCMYCCCTPWPSFTLFRLLVFRCDRLQVCASTGHFFSFYFLKVLVLLLSILLLHWQVAGLIRHKIWGPRSLSFLGVLSGAWLGVGAGIL